MSDSATLLRKDLRKIPLPSLEEVEEALAYVSLSHFVRHLWSVVEKKPFVGGWHIEMVCLHLEAVSNGSLRRLLINVPPRHTKSLIVSVFWPMWDWLRRPDRQFLNASYAQSLSIRDSVKARRIFQSREYQSLLRSYRPDLVLVGDQNTKIRYENSESGYRLATSVEGALTGEGGDIITIDDPHNVIEGESEATRQSVLSWWDESMSTRLNDPKSGAYVVIMQRVHQEDLSGHIIAGDDFHEWDHICLPARYEGENRVKSSLGSRDPRTEEGECLCPERFGDKELRRLESRLGSYGTAGQLQQRPSPRGGGLFKTDRIRLMHSSVIRPLHVKRSVRYWDKAGTEDPSKGKKKGKGPAWSVGLLMHIMMNDLVIISDVVRGRWSYAQREEKIKQTAELDAAFFGGKGKVSVWIEQEPGSGGKESAQRTVRMLAGFDVHSETVTGDKWTRAQPFAAQMEAGNIGCCKEPWYSEYEKELQGFPVGSFKDQVDASSGAFNKLFGLGEKEKTAGVIE